LPFRSFQRLNPRVSPPLNLDKLFTELTMCHLSRNLQNVLQYLQRLLLTSRSGKFGIYFLSVFATGHSTVNSGVYRNLY
jgi:hypothetical protein